GSEKRTEKHSTDFGVSAVAETEPTAGGTRVILQSLTASHGSLAVEADALRQFVTTLPRELKGRIDASIANLSASGELDVLDPLTAPTPVPRIGERLSARLEFAGVRIRAPGKSRPVLSLDDLSGAVKIDTPIPFGAATSIAIDRFNLLNASTSIDADTVRGYTTEVPADLHGSIESKLGSLSSSGRIKNLGSSAAMGFSGDINLRQMSVHSPPGAGHAIAVDGLTIAGRVETPLDRWAPASVKVQSGVTRWATLSYGDNAVTNLDASWRIDNQKLSTDHVTAQIFDGTITGAPSIDLMTHAIDQCDLKLRRIDVHKALANVSPEHLDAVATASGSIHLAMSPKRDLSGNIDLTFDGPGTLRIGQIEEVKQMLAGNFGLDMANLAMHDLEHYPFREGTMHLESAGENSLLKIKFLRQPKSAADVISPHKEIINGQEVMVGSLVVPKIDMTIPITGRSLAEIFSIVSGVHPIIQAANPTPGK
ncbi:MAG TPA: YdbH domain-containing protein, partial [Thermoanaerobaculia bacterium]